MRLLIGWTTGRSWIVLLLSQAGLVAIVGCCDVDVILALCHFCLIVSIWRCLIPGICAFTLNEVTLASKAICGLATLFFKKMSRDLDTSQII